jgi:hypothetical protein
MGCRIETGPGGVADLLVAYFDYLDCTWSSGELMIIRMNGKLLLMPDQMHGHGWKMIKWGNPTLVC